MKGSRLTLVVVAGICLACAGETPTGPTPTPTPDRIFLHLTPSEGELAWKVEPGWEVKLTPTLSWEAQFLAPETGWNFTVVVRLLNAEDAVCLESHTRMSSQLIQGLPYIMRGTDFHITEWPPCGSSDTFAVTTVDVGLKNGTLTSGNLLQARIPCSYRFTRTIVP